MEIGKEKKSLVSCVEGKEKIDEGSHLALRLAQATELQSPYPHAGQDHAALVLTLERTTPPPLPLPSRW